MRLFAIVLGGIVLGLAAPPAVATGKSADECRIEVGNLGSPARTQRAVAQCLLGLSQDNIHRRRSPNNADVLSLTKLNAGRHLSEISLDHTTGTLTVLATVAIDQIGHFDGATNVFRPHPYARHRSFRFHRRCQDAGSFVGQNAFGATVRARRQTCESASVENADAGGIAFSGEIPMQPSVYRDLFKTGVQLEVEFIIGGDRQSLVASKWSGVESATLHRPLEERLTDWTIHGSIVEVRAPSLSATLYVR